MDGDARDFVRGGSGVQGSLRQVHGALEAIALMLELVGIHGILATYGPAFTDVVVIFSYVVGWEVVGAIFDQDIGCQDRRKFSS